MSCSNGSDLGISVSNKKCDFGGQQPRMLIMYAALEFSVVSHRAVLLREVHMHTHAPAPINLCIAAGGGLKAPLTLCGWSASDGGGTYIMQVSMHGVSLHDHGNYMPLAWRTWQALQQ